MERHRDRLSRGLFRRSPFAASARQSPREVPSSENPQAPGPGLTHHMSHRSPRHHGDSSTNRTVRECACGRGLACTGMTQAFRLLGDPRCYYVELPRYRENPPAYKYVFRNNLRSAYLRHLKKSSPTLNTSDFDTPQRRYVALHHFHPAVVKAFHDNPLTSAQKHKVPISITEHELRNLNMEISEDDRILSVTGVATGGYYFVPSYPHEKAHQDLKDLIRTERAAREVAKQQEQSKQQKEEEEEKQEESSERSIHNNEKQTSGLVSSVQNRMISAREYLESRVQKSVATSEDNAVSDEQQIQEAAPTQARSPTPSQQDYEAIKKEDVTPAAKNDRAPDATVVVAAVAGAISAENNKIETELQAVDETVSDDGEKLQTGNEDSEKESPAVAKTSPILVNKPDKEGEDSDDEDLYTDDTPTVGPSAPTTHDGDEPPKENEDSDDEDLYTEEAPAVVDSTAARPVDKPDKEDEEIDVDDDNDDNDHVDSNHSDDNDSTGPGTTEQEDKEFDTLVADSTVASDFDSLWADEANDQNILESQKLEKTESAQSSVSDLDRSTPAILESLTEDVEDESEQDLPATPARSQEIHDEETAEESKKNATSPTRQVDRPWYTPKYRRSAAMDEAAKLKSSGPATFIDPTAVTPPPTPGGEGKMDSESVGKAEETKSESVENDATELHPDASEIQSSESAVESTNHNDPTLPQTPPVDESSADQQSEPVENGITESPPEVECVKSDDLPSEVNEEISSTAPIPTPDLNSKDPGILAPDPAGKSPQRNIPKKVVSPTRAVSKSSTSSGWIDPVAIRLPLPGTDPTMRIQVHNEMIAWESKRRASLSHALELNREEWKCAREILRSGVEEVEFAERLVLGFVKAGIVFADSLQAIHDDTLIDDKGNTVSNSFLQNRLQQRRQAQEYSIDKAQAETVGEGESALLNSLIKSQLDLASTLRDSSQHMEEFILTEIEELRSSVQSRAREIETVGDGILGELKRSEIEVKNIWDVFDAMVTGDLMEYSTHGSMHGSFHGGYGSAHGGGSLNTPLGHSGSVHGFSADNASPIVSSLNSPLVKNTFRQLGNVEDGWLVETHYKTAVRYQKSVLDVAEKELASLFTKIVSLEEDRFRKLHQIMLAFIPRQARLYSTLPRQMKDVLDDLVGLRIDEESLQAAIDQSIKDRSHNHLKKGASHRSSIMNRSRIKSAEESQEDEIQHIESVFGNPFESSMVLLSKVLELKPGGLGGMVNSNWKEVLALVTSCGNLHIFELSQDGNWSGRTPAEAFQSLFPSKTFESQQDWIRKDPIIRRLTPTLSLNLRICGMTIPNMRKRQLEIVEEKGKERRHVGARFLKAVNAGNQRAMRCTLRLSSISDASEWVALLEKTKKEIASKSTQKQSSLRFRF